MTDIDTPEQRAKLSRTGVAVRRAKAAKLAADEKTKNVTTN